MKIFCCQLNIIWENKPANYLKVRNLLDAARPAPGSLVLLPEMFATGFSMNVPAIGESSPSATESFLATAARDYQVFLMGGVVTRGADGRGRNEAVTFASDGTLLARFCKIHPFTLGGEAQHYTAGTGLAMFSWRDFTVAPFICYDLRFPEVFRAAVRRGAQVFTVIANWPSVRENHWITLLRARAIENQAYVAGINRCGNDPKLAYSGRSMVIDPHGEILAEASDQEGLISAELELAPLTAWRHDFPVLNDMKADGFKPILLRR